LNNKTIINNHISTVANNYFNSKKYKFFNQYKNSDPFQILLKHQERSQVQKALLDVQAEY